MDGMFYIVDLRSKWMGNPAVTLWRPKNAGYAYPLSWAGKYDRDTVIKGGDYYTRREGRRWVRFAVPCEVADAIATPPPPRLIDGDAGPIILNTGPNRVRLRRSALLAALVLP